MDEMPMRPPMDEVMSAAEIPMPRPPMQRPPMDEKSMPAESPVGIPMPVGGVPPPRPSMGGTDEMEAEPALVTPRRGRSRGSQESELGSVSAMEERDERSQSRTPKHSVDAPARSRSRSPRAPGEIRIPIVLKRRTSKKATPRVESTYLVGRELAWGDWASSDGDLDWRVIPLRWGDKGDLFSMCVHRKKKKIKICCTDASQPFDQWPEVAFPDWPLKGDETPRWIPFTAQDEHSHMVAQTETKTTIFHIPSPSEKWVKVPLLSARKESD